MLQEVNLTSLCAIHPEPIGIGKLFGEVAIASVRVAILRSGLLSWEGCTMLFIELLHEFAGENFDSDSHGACISCHDVLQGNC